MMLEKNAPDLTLARNLCGAGVHGKSLPGIKHKSDFKCVVFVQDPPFVQTEICFCQNSNFLVQERD